ncbi:Vms1/Ankzf1 family peptidyl-tRNA hydrolase [Methanolobus bombayensis]|uniref:Vms1/Ankzf1 family peptidyl-tRNA hydrolase n=1 Tax=Methanolobus bombayensis TaxID=38023 RepID=UPI001AEB3A39|nr:Vms1/Ankzf1 family peptidyl-tRNA hydrolase [Methanolobus bombayensis]MBP1909439.1 putative component of type VI protein secretion system [Methanolobus bombayensis]
MIEKEKVVGNISSLFNKYSGKEELETEINRLQSHIVELELDVRTANIRYGKSAESEKKAIAAKQEAEEKLNSLEIRLKTLEHEVEKERNDAPASISFTFNDEFSKQQTANFLNSLSTIRYNDPVLITMYIAANESPAGIKEYGILSDNVDSETLALAEKLDSNTGLVLFHSPNHMINEILVPPLPLEKSSWGADNKFDISVISELLNKDAGICVLVAHAGESFTGFSFDSQDFDSFQMIKTSVKAKHSKGGFSQRRFERLRDEDIAHHIDKVRLALKDLLDEFRDSIDYLILAGDLPLAKEIASDFPFDIPQVHSPSDVRIEKHNISGIMKQLMTCRRYRL